MNKLKKYGLPLVLSSILLVGGCGLSKNYEVDYTDIAKVKNDSSKAAVHDPSIIEADGIYYIFGSHLSAAKSTDMQNWEMMTSVQNAYSKNNPVYTDMNNLGTEEFAFTGNGASEIPTDDKGTHIWAPDVIYNKANNKYFMYFCPSSTFNASTIVYATSDKIEGPYEWQGNLLYSGETAQNLDKTDILNYVDRDYAEKNYTAKAGYEYNFKDYPNCIDPTVFYDKDGKMWMVYGSWSGGIFLIEIDEKTGNVIHPQADPKNNVDPYYGKRLIGGGHNSIEAPYILYDAESDYYYLFVSYGELTRDGGYQIRVFRSDKVDGDYVDMNQRAPKKGMAHADTGLKLSGNYHLPSLEVGYKATGHNSAFIDQDGRKYVAYHTRFDKASEQHTPKVKQYLLNAEGWPCLLPYTTSGEQVSATGYDKKEVVGRYYYINQGTAIDANVATPDILYLNSNGEVKGEGISGTWEQTEDTYFMTLNIDGKEYSGIFCKMQDEAGTEVMTFSAVGSNESVWGVKYDK